MSNFGDFTRIQPKPFGGRIIGGAVRFWGESGSEPPAAHCSGVIERVTDLGGGLYSLTMQRGPQTFFFVVAPSAPGQGATVVQYSAIMGGNVALPREWQRGYSPFNDAAQRGSLMGSRVVPGDGIVINRATQTLPCLVEQANPHAITPTEVNYAGNVPLPRFVYPVIELFDIAANRRGPLVLWQNRLGRDVAAGEVITTPEWSGEAVAAIASGSAGNVRIDVEAEILFEGINAGTYPTGLLIWDDSTPTLATRALFVPPGGTTTDPAFLPADLGAAGFDGERYWIDPASYRVRLGSGCFLAGDEAELFWWLRSRAAFPLIDNGSVLVVTGSGTGTGSMVDAVTFSGIDVAGDFDIAAAITLGTGAIEWRQTSASNGRRVTIHVGETGPVSLTYRASIGAAAVEEAFTAPVYTLPYEVRIRKVGAVYTAFARQSDASSWTELGEVTLTGVVAASDGMVGTSAWSGNALRTALLLTGQGARLYVPIGIAFDQGSHAAFQSTGRVPFVVAQNTGLPTADLAEVFNVTTGAIMGEGSGTRRDQYRVIDGELWTVAENSGDQWRVKYNASGTPPTPPGRAPRPVANQVALGWVEIAPEPNEGFLPTTNIANNIANWHDEIVARFEGGIIPQVGESVSFVRYGVFMPTAPPSIQYAIRNGAEEQWLPVPAEAMVPVWFAGVVLLTEEWLSATFAAGDAVCFRAVGTVLQTDLLTDVERWRELERVAAGFDELWIQIPISGSAPTRYAVLTIQGFGNVSRDELGRVNDVGLGFTNDNYRAFIPDVRPPGLGETPFWDVDSGVPYLFDSFLRSGYVWNETDEEALIGVEGDGFLAVYTDAGPVLGTDGRSFLGRLAGQNPLQPDTLNNSLNAQTGRTFSPDGVFAALPSGAVIERAWLEVKFTGLITQTWQSIWRFGPGLIAYRLETRNGVRVLEIERDAEGEILIDYQDPDVEPQTVEGGPIGFAIVGRRIDSANVTRWNGERLTIDASEYISVGVLGSGQLTEVVNDEWQLVDVTGAVQELLRLRESLTAWDRYEIWATTGPPIGADPDGLSAWARGNHPQWQYTISGDLNDPEQLFEGTGRFARWDSLEVGRLLVRFAGNLTDPTARPLTPPAAV
jgi:hypothetical protein